MPDLVVDPDDIANIRQCLKEARERINAAFDAPDDAFRIKLRNTHGITSREGVDGIRHILARRREDVRSRLNRSLDDCDDALKMAATAYRTTDHTHGAALDEQLQRGG
ncbi:type VII secretion target [Mycobacterium lentiflavum]|uniref:type VII secretion target n=1 Tax=Mycobacterium lentiflavum TaxID=141349 RepID=UPI0033140604